MPARRLVVVDRNSLWEAETLDHPLTVVLPIHNCERQLRSSVLDILDLAPSMPVSLEIVIVDDGSTDDSYESACELVRQYPQVTVLRQSIRQGLGAALDLVRNRLRKEKVVVHDGVSTIDVAQLQALLQSDRSQEGPIEKAVTPSSARIESSGSRRFASVRTLHNRMENAHRSAAFRWMQLEVPLVPRRCPQASVPAPQQAMSRGPMLDELVQQTGGPLPLVSLPLGMAPMPQD